MKEHEMIELKKRIDFNLTEHETLVRLIDDARIKGQKAQKELLRLRDRSSELTELFTERNLLLDESFLHDVKLSYETIVGIDGSFQLVGGTGGIWYAPISVARVIFPSGSRVPPKVDIFWAGIEEITPKDAFKPNFEATVRMLSGESEAILDWGVSRKEGFALIDGPVVDPPSYGDRAYVKNRCDAIKKCLEKSSLIGCVKRSQDKFHMTHLLKEKIIDQKDFDDFPSDQHLFAHTFMNLRKKGYTGAVFSRLIDLSGINDAYAKYDANKVYIGSFFLQKNIRSQVLRVDLAFPDPIVLDDPNLQRSVFQAAKLVSDWTYPGQDYPLPVFLAHEKCNIRRGCAEVLYDEIITRGMTVDPYSQTILTQLR